MPHLPSCEASKNWRGEKARFVIYQTVATDADLIKELGGEDLVQNKLYWLVTLPAASVEEIRNRVDSLSIDPSCACFDPTLSKKQNRDFVTVKSWNEESAGWPPGKP